MASGGRAASDRIAESLRVLREAVDAIPASLSIKGRDGRYVLANAYVAQLYGMTPEEILGQTVREVMGPEAASNIEAADAQVLRTGSPSGLWQFGEPDQEGDQRYWLIGKWPLTGPDGTEVSHIVTVSFDLTELHHVRLMADERGRQLQAITSRAPVMLLKTAERPNGRSTISFVSGRIADELGVDRDAVAQDASAIMALVHPDDRARVLEHWRQTMRSGEPYAIEFRCVDRSGRVRWLSSTATHEVQPDGLTVSDEIVVDITELHIARETAQQREQQLVSLAQNVPGAIVRRITGSDGGARIHFLVGEFMTRLGIDPGVAAEDASVVWRAMDPEDRVQMEHAWRESMARLEPSGSTVRFTATDGSTVWYRSRWRHHRLENGDIATDTVAIDVTDEMLARQQLETERELLRSVTANIPGLVFRRVNTPDGGMRYDFIQGALLARFGVTAEEARQDPDAIWRHFNLADMQRVQDVIMHAVATLEPFSYTVRCLVPSSREERHIEVTGTPHALADGSVVTDGIAVDVTDRVRAESEAREHRALLQQVIDAMPAAINVKDREGRVELANKALADYYGVTPEAMLWTSREQPRDPAVEDEFTLAWDREVLAGGKVSDARELAYVDQGGRTRYWISRKSPLRDPESGKMERVVTVSLEVTDRIEAERRAREAEARLASIADNLPGMILRRVHHADGRYSIAYAGGRLAVELGLSPSGGEAEKLSRWLHDDDRPRLMDDLRRMAQSLEPLVTLDRYVLPDGSLRWVRNISQPRRLDDGTVISDAILLDVTERERARDLARQRDELLRSVARSVPGAILRWRIDADGMVEQEYAAGRLIEAGLLESPRERVPVREIWSALRSGDAERLAGRLTGGAVRRGTLETELSLDPGGDIHWLRLFARRRHAGGGEASWDIIVLDVTESHRYEEQLRIAQKMDAIGSLTGGIAHDFNNILAIIVANLDLMLSTETLGEEDRRSAEAALRAAERGAELTGRLLSYARDRPVSLQPLSCSDSIDSLARLMERTLGPEIELDLRHGDDVPEVVVDPSELETALMNLVVNARDALDGRGRITVETRAAVFDVDDTRPPGIEPGAYAVVSVTDFGCGMTPEVQRRVFEPLFTTKTEGHGTGLGLTMVYNFARQARGHVSLYSEPGRGTTIRVYLPAHDQAWQERPPTPRVPCGPAPHEGNARVLLVDDNAEARQALASQLRRQGYEVTEAGSGEEALALFGDGSGFELLISDVIMSGAMTGVELADRVRHVRPKIGVLLISGYPADALAERQTALARYELIGKPFRQQELLACIARELDGGTH